ncbi:hypothetical protein EV127DRAFT_43781 [Xylaria flabelliformis]|nr:hypothetical protein EV127DRAFT_43781 [Xylaria flabelliformis]
MTDGKSHHQAQLESGTLPNFSGTRMENAATFGNPSTSSAASSMSENSNHHLLNEPSQAHKNEKQADTTASVQIPNLRPSLGPREFSTDFMDEIRKVIRQEFLGAYTPKEHSRNDDGGVSGMSINAGTGGQEKGPSYLDTIAKSTRGGSDDGSCSPVTVPDSGSDRTSITRTPTLTPSPSSTASAPPLSLVPPTMAAKPEPPRPGARLSDNVTLVRNPLSGPTSVPAKKAPWPMNRRMSSSGGEPVSEWGVLFDGNGFATARLGQVLQGLAHCLAEKLSPRGGAVVTPEKLGLLYSRFRIEGEVHPFEGEHPFGRVTR